MTATQQALEDARCCGVSEVQTFAGWVALADWKPYGEAPDLSKYVSFEYDQDAHKFREIPKERLGRLIIDKMGVFGLWPTR